MSEDTQYVKGSRPTHTHVGEKSGKWFCNSPYCEDMATDKPEDGGPEVIHPPYSPSNPPRR